MSHIVKSNLNHNGTVLQAGDVLPEGVMNQDEIDFLVADGVLGVSDAQATDASEPAAPAVPDAPAEPDAPTDPDADSPPEDGAATDAPLVASPASDSPEDQDSDQDDQQPTAAQIAEDLKAAEGGLNAPSDSDEPAAPSLQ